MVKVENDNIKSGDSEKRCMGDFECYICDKVSSIIAAWNFPANWNITYHSNHLLEWPHQNHQNGQHHTLLPDVYFSEKLWPEWFYNSKFAPVKAAPKSAHMYTQGPGARWSSHSDYILKIFLVLGLADCGLPLKHSIALTGQGVAIKVARKTSWAMESQLIVAKRLQKLF